MSSTFTGILAACVTPFTADGSEIDLAGIRAQTAHIIDAGVNGLVPGGSTGEFTALTIAERKASNRAYIEAAAGRVPVVAGTGAPSTAETIELSRDAEAAGADALMIVPPFYDTPAFDEVIAHYSAISEAVNIPIMFYNIPAATGLELSAEQLGRLGAETGVTSYKDTGGDFPKFTEVHFDHADDIQALNGWDTLTFAALALGAEAGVWGAASVIPGLCADLYQAVAVDADLARGRELWARINPICVFLESHNYACAIKTGLELVGVPAGPTRAPVQPLAPEYREEFRGLLTAAGVETHA
ncbi:MULTISPECIES: dihydrodipicolinate synthase family protein [unclassified Brevibacterium]|uniref:dihydrodipicolinate synthase family protein n=1 Tax=unclassified Brevibacterium TaxID=2614124 RepID=UPI001E553BFA|nr:MULTISPECIES: dihydrodipicolinate synthase family protein [unclassified Brevibacterium]MCD1286529.1 dihydrodipicolinate synthase family protein [Brevibacterium sp. CCUG 69071]MDK8434240.1 dihydrodipicolinate synthase family protein [Brevibacterium sp. H-BE7]